MNEKRIKKNLENMNEWVVLTKVHLTRVACEEKCISLMVDAGMSLKGKNNLQKMESHLINVKNCLSMIEQYMEIQ